MKVNPNEEDTMQIGQLSRLTGVSTRALRHYDESGVLVPGRTSSGYRSYTEDDVVRVHQITAMIAAGLGTATIKQYLDCARTGDHGTHLEMCPRLRADLDAVAERLRAQHAALGATVERLEGLAAPRVPA
ncbi:DNA-binding transcriptional MerR regulator [Nocardioides zeae]|uniref:DNA-binding transcriptional MerR regulator n=1 Tax=Nocardioides zeae TaxID=1457234 RepID=A0ACC6INK3_9ACTN|nr:MerR family transcriptional regulator [Nocardioides zeae]MDR6172885.1 DNA-binding transcriptional MerR regulator [Nocardioides zeae]MDR6212279.1 DNA-binding transcriptional MerR regulator [Nocardioides zeae]